MTTPTVAVTIVSGAINGTPLANGSAVLQLTAQDVVIGTNGTIVPATPVTVPLDVNGMATTNSFPNVLGTVGTQTKVTLFDSTGVQQATALATIPNTACNLHDVINLSPPPSLTSAQVAVNLARLWAFGSTPPDGVNKSAKQSALDAGTSATAASTSAGAAAQSASSVSFLYPGIYATAPTTRPPNGTGPAMQAGDRANFSDGYEYHYTGTAWVSDAKNAAASATNASNSLAALMNRYQGAFASDPTLRPDGTALQVGDSYFNSTANLFKVYNGSTWQASDINTANLAASTGSTTVGDGNSTLADRIAAINLADYTALRAYAGPTKAARVTGYLATTAPSGIAGLFTVDDSDTTSADNGGTIIVASNGKRWKRSYTDEVAAKWFGAKGDNSTDDTTSIVNAAAASNNTKAPGTATYKITSSITLNNNNKIVGDGQYATSLYNAGTTAAVTTPVSTPGGPKSNGQGLFNIQITANSGAPVAAPGLFVQQTGFTYWEKAVIQYHRTALKLEGAVSTTFRDVILQQATTGLQAGGINSLDAVTLTNFYGGRITTSTTAININGYCKGLFFDGTDIESVTNLYTESGGYTTDLMVFRNTWLESITAYDLGSARRPVFDTCKFAGDITITGGFAPVLREVYVTPPGAFPMLKVMAEIADVTATGENWRVASDGQHGMTLAMPTIGSASTPADRYAASETAQSALFMALGGRMLGSSVGMSNLMPAPISQAGYWGGGSATITTGQTDPFGGTTATLVSGVNSGTTAYKGTGQLSGFTSGSWYVYQMVVKAQAAGNIVGLRVNGATLDKFLQLLLPDTNWRVIHMMFKADQATASFNFYHGGGAIVDAICVAAGAELRPFIPYGAVVPNAFWMELGNVVMYGSGPPGSGTYAQGMRVLNSAPAAAGNIGWVCTTGGTPGTWKTYGAIAA